jgi:hypothetical protein
MRGTDNPTSLVAARDARGFRLHWRVIECELLSGLKRLLKKSALKEDVNQTGFTGEPKAQKVSYDQREPREPFFDRGTCARGAHGSGERSGLQIAVAGVRLYRGEVRMK